MEKIQKHLQIEEESRKRDKNENSYKGISKANAVNKPSQSNKGNRNKGNSLGPKKDQGKFKRSQIHKLKETKVHALFVGNVGIMLVIAGLRRNQIKKKR